MRERNSRRFPKLVPMLVLSALVLTACGSAESPTGAEGDDENDVVEDDGVEDDEAEESDPDETPTDESITIRASTGLSPEHAWVAGFDVPWMEAIEAETDGLVTFDFFTAGELIPHGEEFEPLQAGTIDLAFPLMTPVDPTRFPLSEIAMLPLVESSATIASEAYWNLLTGGDELIDGQTFVEYAYEDRHDLKVWPMPATDVYVLSTVNRVESLDDLSGLSIRGSSRLHEMFIDNWGATPTFISATELFDALSRGAVDGALYSVPDWTGYGFENVYRYTLEGLSAGHFAAPAVMTRATWDDLPPEAQEAFDGSVEDVYWNGVQEWIDREEESRRLNEEWGGEFLDMSDVDPDLAQAAEDAIVQTWEQWIDDLEERGEPGREAAILWRDLIVAAGGTVPDELMEL